MQIPFIRKYGSEFRFLFGAALGIGIVAYTLIISIILALPHLPLANKRTFYALLRAQMAVDEGKRLSTTKRQMVLFLGSSVVERGVSERYMDSIFGQFGIPFETMNAGTGGFCAEANLPMFRAMLQQGLRPSYVIYGVGIQELNGASSVHTFIDPADTAAVKLKSKSLWNLLQYGPTALSPLITADHLHQYLFAANNAFRDVPNLNLFDRLMFGENMAPQDSIFHFEQKYLDDLQSIVKTCQDLGIKVAIYNAPLRSRPEKGADEPYLHRADSYRAILTLAYKLNIPLWNFDQKGFFTHDEFQDNYHLTPIGARKISGMLADSIAHWQEGQIVRDETSTLD